MGKLSSILVCLALALSIGVLSYNYRQINSDQHREVLQVVDSLRNLNQLLNNEVMAMRLKTDANYDRITALALQGQQTIIKLKSEHSEINRNLNIENSLKDYAAIFEQKVTYIEGFKAKNSIVRNSLSFLPHISQELHEKLTLSGPSAHAGLVAEASELLNVILAQALGFGFDRNQSRVIQTQIKKLSASLPRLSGETKKIMEAFILHTSIVNENLDELKNLTENILKSESVELEVKLIKSIDDYVNAQKERAQSLFRLSTLISIILLIYVIFNLIHLWKSASAIKRINESLETKVQQRTKELEQSASLIVDQQRKIFLASKLSAIGEMASGIAHEINNPVTILMGKLGELRDLMRGEWDEKYANEIIDKSETTLWRITKIIRGLRSFSQETSNEEMEIKSLRHLVEETLDFCTEKFKKNGVQLEVDDIPEEAEILCRPVQITQVILNLLNNANDALAETENKRIKIELIEESENFFSLRIRDNGKGIPPELQEKIFQPFFTTKEHGKGTGLGLSISKGIIESHKGELKMKSKPGETIFTCKIPRFKRSQKAAAHAL